MPRAYIRCNSGHYFHGRSCPYDGWSSPDVVNLFAVLERPSEPTLSVETLRQAGVSQAALERTIVIDFGWSDSVFDAISPESYVVNGKHALLVDLGRPFK